MKILIIFLLKVKTKIYGMNRCDDLILHSAHLNRNEE